MKKCKQGIRNVFECKHLQSSGTFFHSFTWGGIRDFQDNKKYEKDKNVHKDTQRLISTKLRIRKSRVQKYTLVLN